MRSRFTLQLIYCLMHMMAWIRSQPVGKNTEVNNIFHGTLSTEEKRESAAKVYTEGGSVSTVADGNAEENSAKSKSILEYQDIPLPSSEASSKIKPRKEAIIPNKIVGRKGAPPSTITPAPVYETPTEDVPTPSYTMNVRGNTSTMSPIAFTNTSTTMALAKDNAHSISSSLPTKSTTPVPIPHKPKVTLVPSDSDSFLKSLKNDRNVVIPVLALVLVPLLVLFSLFIYKRIQDSRGTYYSPVDFLVDEMYND